MTDLHATLAPSAAERWISCPASVRLEAAAPPEPDSSYSLEGTKAHALGELEASLAFGKITLKEHGKRYKQWLKMAPVLDDENLIDMRGHVKTYIDLIRERLALYPNSQVVLEQQVGTGIESCWGTADTVIVSPDHVEIIDLKYGQGVPVSATGNPQLRLYGVGALEMFGDVLGETQVVRVTVFQPRLDSTSTEEMAPGDLRAWRDSIIPLAQEALHFDRPRFGPSDTACRWCAVAGTCRARMEKATQEDFDTGPDLITPEEMGGLLARIPEIKAWCKAVEDSALRKAYSEGVTIPGWKVVLSGGKRGVADETAAINLLVSKGFTHEEIATLNLKGIGDLEKVIKSKATGPKKEATLESVIGDLVAKSPGKPSIVSVDDARPAIAPDTEAAKEFAQ